MRATLGDSGQVGEDLLAVDWESTPLGDPEQWSESLSHTVRLLLASDFPMWLGWGEELTFFCNEAYRVRTLGGKYPWALGRPAREVWSEIWHQLEPRLTQVLTTGTATWDDSLQMFLQRSGYVEETFFTFSCSPVHDDDGSVAGVLLVVAEVTQEVVNERRLGTLRQLGIRVSSAESVASAVRAGCAHLGTNGASLPWVSVYLFDDGGDAVLAGTAGIEPGHAAAPERIRHGDPDAVWPVDALTGGRLRVEALGDRFADLPTGDWTIPPSHAVIAPLRDPLRPRPYGFAVLGANPYRPVDATYVEFSELIAGHLAAAITDARAVEEQMRRSETQLLQAQRLARLGSWEIDLEADRVTGSETFLEIIERTQEELDELGARAVSDRFLRGAGDAGGIDTLRTATPESMVEYETTLTLPSGRTRAVHVRGEVVEMGADGPRLLRGSAQDITEQRALRARLIASEAERRILAREQEIADQLQRSLLPEVTFDSCALDVSTFYRPGLAGTRVGGDWYDVIDLGGGRTALVIGDVMGHGVRAAAVMGQVKSAVRAYARLDLSPAEVAENMDGLVQDMSGDEIITWVYAVYDPAERTISYANAGHLPPLLVDPSGNVTRLEATAPPLGAGFFGTRTESVPVRPGSVVALYTDGLAERRHSDVEEAVESLAGHLVAQRDVHVSELSGLLVAQMLEELGEGSDDVALAVVRVQDPERQVLSRHFPAEAATPGAARRLVRRQLAEWDVAGQATDDLVVVAGELVTNALLHGEPPIDLRLQRTDGEIVVEVKDGSVAPPRRRPAGPDDEDGRGLSIVEAMADRWGSRTISVGGSVGKVVWAARALERRGG